jgi:hypothetical protein
LCRVDETDRRCGVLNQPDTNAVAAQGAQSNRHPRETCAVRCADTVCFTVRLPRKLIVRIDAGLRRRAIRLPRSIWIAQALARAADEFPEEAA